MFFRLSASGFICGAKKTDYEGIDCSPHIGHKCVVALCKAPQLLSLRSLLLFCLQLKWFRCSAIDAIVNPLYIFYLNQYYLLLFLNINMIKKNVSFSSHPLSPPTSFLSVDLSCSLFLPLSLIFSLTMHLFKFICARINGNWEDDVIPTVQSRRSSIL